MLGRLLCWLGVHGWTTTFGRNSDTLPEMYRCCGRCLRVERARSRPGVVRAFRVFEGWEEAPDE
ncbi:MAG: hypothetical protein CMH55_07600 [Myxococcales bacterium]|nr:hypothetical protein [Myxococcales bacterium]